MNSSSLTVLRRSNVKPIVAKSDTDKVDTSQHKPETEKLRPIQTMLRREVNEPSCK